MRRIFTLAALLLLASLNTSLLAQCSQNVTQNFSVDNGGFSSNFMTYSATAKNFSDQYNKDRTYTITSNDFTLSNQSTVTITFRLVAEGTLTSVSVSIKDKNSSTSIAGSTLNSGGVYCTTFSGLSALQNKTVQFIITAVVSQNGQKTTTFDDFGTSLPEAAATRVDFVSFDAKKLTAGTQLNWKVGTEDNVDHYEIERSNGTSYVAVGSVPASGQTSYSFTDPHAAQGTVLYRIRSVDNDGKYKYSTIISLKNGVATIVLKAFPIPALHNLTVQHPVITGNGEIALSSGDGRIIRSVIPVKGSMQTDLNLDGLKSGIYLLRLNTGNGQFQTLKIMKQ